MDAVHAQFGRVINAPEEKLPKVADHLEAARHDVLAFTPFPKGLWQHDEWIEARRYLGLELIQQAQTVGTPTTGEATTTTELAFSA